ncbi:Hypothetical predicted protein [Podarcis lilfordi]|nr:Hypothetical predicted protein [Podarcis lilfordi]
MKELEQDQKTRLVSIWCQNPGVLSVGNSKHNYEDFPLSFQVLSFHSKLLREFAAVRKCHKWPCNGNQEDNNRPSTALSGLCE